MNKQLNRNIELRGFKTDDSGQKSAEFVISSGAVDTYQTVFVPEGANFERYHKNPIVAYNHRTGSDNPDMIIGTSEIFQEDGKTIGRVLFESEDINPLAEKIARKVEAGTLRMASIGAQPLKGSWGVFEDGENPEVLYFREWELMEWSITPVGSNPEAHKRNNEGLEAFKTTITREIEVIEPEVIESKKMSVLEAQILINSNK